MALIFRLHTVDGNHESGKLTSWYGKYPGEPVEVGSLSVYPHFYRVDMVDILLFAGFHTYQVVHDFFSSMTW